MAILPAAVPSTPMPQRRSRARRRRVAAEATHLTGTWNSRFVVALAARHLLGRTASDRPAARRTTSSTRSEEDQLDGHLE